MSVVGNQVSEFLDEGMKEWLVKTLSFQQEEFIVESGKNNFAFLFFLFDLLIPGIFVQARSLGRV